MKRMKGPDYKDKTVFGVPLIVHVQRYGHPLPISLQLALRFLRSQCLDQVHSLVHICKTDYKVHSKLGQSQSYSKLIRKLDVQPLLRFYRQISHANPNSVCFYVFLPVCWCLSNSMSNVFASFCFNGTWILLTLRIMFETNVWVGYEWDLKLCGSLSRAVRFLF